MSRKNTAIIEQKAVNAVNESLLSTGRITSSIKVGDTTPSWDGEFYVHKDGSGAKEGIIKIPVQVKGSTMHKYFNESFPYFCVSIKDLEIWKNHGGVFLFVVHIKPNNEKIIYYVALTVVKIRKYLLEQREGNEIKVPITLFPLTYLGIMTTIENFAISRKRQYSFADSKLISIFDLEKCGLLEKTNFVIPSSQIIENPQQLLELSNHDDFYLYAQTDSLGTLVPISDDIKLEVISTTFERNVRIGEKIFFTSYDFHRRLDSMEIHFGKSIVFKIGIGKPSKINIKPFGSLDETINNLEFIIALCREKEFFVDEKRIPLENMEEFDINKYLKPFKYFLDMRKTLNRLGETHDLDYSNLSEKERKSLHIVANSVLFGSPISFATVYKTDVFSLLSIGNLNILYWCENIGENNFLVKNFFGIKTQFALYQDNDLNTPHKVTKYFNLKRDHFELATNLDYHAIMDDLDCCEKSEIVTEQLTLFVLEILHAFDSKIKKGINDKDLLDVAESYSNWVNLYSEKLNEELKINKLQIAKRKRDLTELEKLELTEIRKNCDNHMIKCAANILLDRHDSAQDCFDEMSDEDKKLFYSYPISNLGKLIF